MTSGKHRVLVRAAAEGWEDVTVERLLILRKYARDLTGRMICHIAQVLFRDGDRWDYAITWTRHGSYFTLGSSESEPKIVKRRRDFFAHLAAVNSITHAKRGATG